MNVPARDRVRAVIDDVIERGTEIADDGDMHSLFPVAIPPAEGEALRDVVARTGAARTIETGLGYGVSSLYICEGLLIAGHPEPRHVAIDPYQSQRFANIGLRLLHRAGLDDVVDHIEQRSEIALPAIVDKAGPFDVAFLDGNHRYDGVFVDLFYLGRVLRPGGAVFLDDYQLPGVRRAAAFFVTNLGWAFDEISPEDGEHQWALMSTATRADERPYDFFIEF